MSEQLMAYKCDLCGKLYETYSDAETCEENDLDISKAKIEATMGKTHKYPDELSVVFLSGASFTFRRVEKCSVCGGSGGRSGGSGCDGWEECSNCGGRGIVIARG